MTPDRKSIRASRSFGQPVTTYGDLKDPVAVYTTRAPEKMRRQNLAKANLHGFVETNSFRTDDRQYYATQPVQLPVATSDTGKLTRAARSGLAPIWKPGYRYKKAGVVFLDLRPAGEVLGGLFDAPDTPAKRRLMGVMDRLNSHYGRDTITYAASGRRRSWKLRSDQLSPRSGTSWDELLKVQANRRNANFPGCKLSASRCRGRSRAVFIGLPSMVMPVGFGHVEGMGFGVIRRR